MRVLSQLNCKVIARAYRRMAEIGYRPAAPSDGFGNIAVPEEELDLEKEIKRYLEGFDVEREPWVGFPDALEYDAYVFIIEAVRELTGMAPHWITIALLKEAVTVLEARCDDHCAGWQCKGRSAADGPPVRPA